MLRRFIVWSCAEQVDFVALWVLHTYVFEALRHHPVPRRVLGRQAVGQDPAAVRAAPPAGGPALDGGRATEAVLFRKVDKDQPTLLVDEIDATFGKDSKVTEGLRAIYNAGYRAGPRCARCVGNNHETNDFDVYCPKAFAGLEGLPDTVKDRSGRIELRRRARNEPKPERLRLSRPGPSWRHWPTGSASGPRRSRRA